MPVFIASTISFINLAEMFIVACVLGVPSTSQVIELEAAIGIAIRSLPSNAVTTRVSIVFAMWLRRALRYTLDSTSTSANVSTLPVNSIALPYSLTVIDLGLTVTLVLGIRSNSLIGSVSSATSVLSAL